MARSTRAWLLAAAVLTGRATLAQDLGPPAHGAGRPPIVATPRAATPAPAPATATPAGTTTPTPTPTATTPAGTTTPTPATAATAPASPVVDATALRLTLHDAVLRALGHNPSALVAEAEIRRTAALVQEVRSQAFPTLIGSATYTRLDGNRVYNGAVISAENQAAGNVTLSVPIVAPVAWTAWWHAEDNLGVAQVSAAEARRQVAIAVARTYLNVIAQRRVIEATERARVNAQAHQDFAQARFVGGVGNRVDVVRAAQQTAADVSQVQTALVGLSRLREALGVLVGIDGAVEAAEDSPVEASVTESPTALADAARRRTDVRLAEVRSRAADRVVRDDWADYLPSLVGVFQPFFQDPPTLSIPATGWQAELVLTVPFYDGGLRYGHARERAALADEAHATLDGTLRQARSDTRVAVDEIRRADLALGAARDASRLAAEALQLVTLSYRAGASTNLEVIDAERAALDADTAVAVAEDNARQARLDLLISVGRFP